MPAYGIRTSILYSYAPSAGRILNCFDSPAHSVVLSATPALSEAEGKDLHVLSFLQELTARRLDSDVREQSSSAGMP